MSIASIYSDYVSPIGYTDLGTLLNGKGPRSCFQFPASVKFGVPQNSSADVFL